MSNYGLKRANQIKQQKRGKVGLYKTKEGFICFGHLRGFEPTDARPIITGCFRCKLKCKQ